MAVNSATDQQANGKTPKSGQRRLRQDTVSKPKTKSSRTLGPLPDLERHLPVNWWDTLFNAIYLKTDGDVVENNEATEAEVDLLIQVAGLEPNDRILDVCCGQGRHCMELARRGFRHLAGVDRSRYLIRLAKRRARQAKIEISFHEGDARKFRIKNSDFHVAMLLGNSFGYFDAEADDLAVLEATKRALGSGGTIVLDITDGAWLRQNYEPRSWEWIDAQHLVCRERSLAADDRRLVSREVVVHAEKGVLADQFYAERLYTQPEIDALLDAAGFTNIRHHGMLTGISDRNQDLGMMANRMVITAESPRATSSLHAAAVPYPQVTVLLGDSQLPDPCKRDGKFNEEDFQTIERMKAALDDLSQYSFSYMSNHATLISDLRNSPPDFVLNLCDEGFGNDAFKELHVPAVLELFGIPYSGAAPAALGLCYNKSHIRSIAAGMDIPVPLETYVEPDDNSATIPSILPALLKPNCGDSSVGITARSVVFTAAALIDRLDELRTEFPGPGILVQEFLAGPEYSVGVLGNPGTGFRFLPILEVDYSHLEDGLPKILGYESKWLPDSPYWSQIKYREADLSDATTRVLCDHSARLFERTGCRDYARFDFRAAEDGTIKLLEVNPNPGWCWDGKFNLMAASAGMRYADFLAAVIEAAQGRYIRTA